MTVSVTMQLPRKVALPLPMTKRQRQGESHDTLMIDPGHYQLPDVKDGLMVVEPANDLSGNRVQGALSALYGLATPWFKLLGTRLKLRVGTAAEQYGETASYRADTDTVTLARHYTQPDEVTPLVLAQIFERNWARVEKPTTPKEEARMSFLAAMQGMRTTAVDRYASIVGPYLAEDPVSQVQPGQDMVDMLGYRALMLIKRAFPFDEDNPVTNGIEQDYQHGLQKYLTTLGRRYSGLNPQQVKQTLGRADELLETPGLDGEAHMELYKYLSRRTGEDGDLLRTLWIQLMAATKHAMIAGLVSDIFADNLRQNDDAEVALEKTPEQQDVRRHFGRLKQRLAKHLLGNTMVLGTLDQAVPIL